MPPKKSNKAVQKEKAKVIEDKTFGLKNKNKSSKVNKYVQQVQAQVNAAGNPKDKKAAADRKQTLEEKKRAEEQKRLELAELFKPVVQQKVPFGVDPKTILCQAFKAGQCIKGPKCKFSHDLDVERRVAKLDIYTDKRDENGKKEDTMEDWDQAKLEEAVNKKHGGNVNKPTDIVCKYFIEAIESRKYGWFWECPNGGSCKYRHALPPGFVLKKKETEEERKERELRERENEISIEDFLETERHNLGPNLTPVNAETFAKWKADRKAREALEKSEASKKKKEAFDKMKAGMKSGMSFSGRELFDFNPEWAGEGDDDDAMDVYVREESDGEEGVSGRDQNGTGPNREDKGKEAAKGPEVENVAVAEDLFEVEDLEDLDDDDD
ncbi:hypothetical protein HK104_002772 [Borealophlyctis nickersoniae]|nr:hypothetical protein HK104_002772 [Borealophlyctis nickersoniae]